MFRASSISCAFHRDVFEKLTRGDVALRDEACLPMAALSKYGPAGPGVATLGAPPAMYSWPMNVFARTCDRDVQWTVK